LKIAKQEKDESSYNFKINFVLAAVMKAEAQKCKFEAGHILFSKYFKSCECKIFMTKKTLLFFLLLRILLEKSDRQKTII
ncbi:MAG: hypothetical protein LBJ32_01290, partial [Oscillospiraceae bacterium]|nr:hypothetical protein [Oscillospiraceae bacterium]